MPVALAHFEKVRASLATIFEGTADDTTTSMLAGAAGLGAGRPVAKRRDEAVNRARVGPTLLSFGKVGAYLTAIGSVDVDGTVADLSTIAAASVGARVGRGPRGNLTINRARLLVAFVNLRLHAAALATILGRGTFFALANAETGTTGDGAVRVGTPAAKLTVNGTFVHVAAPDFGFATTLLATVLCPGVDYAGTGSGTRSRTTVARKGAFRPVAVAVHVGLVGDDEGAVTRARGGVA